MSLWLSNLIKKENESMNLYGESIYLSSNGDGKFDHPVVTKELNGNKIMLYEAWGIPSGLISYKTEFINKTKQMYLIVKGKYEVPDLDFENNLNIRIHIDTEIYDGYEVTVSDGLVKVTLHEIKNEAPELRDVGKRKKSKQEEDEEPNVWWEH
jgi:hypothetical protein